MQELAQTPGPETVAVGSVREAALAWLAFDDTHTIESLAVTVGLQAGALKCQPSIAAEAFEAMDARNLEATLARRLIEPTDAHGRAGLVVAR